MEGMVEKVFPNRGKLFPFRKYRKDTKVKQGWNGTDG
jgi:hypothetical protein